ncbi:hypothetical protein [Haladaptatus salinisoli]|uniref:hypothetical protein n=1 Tax=Haladaptatus salinisoli TaxID=2884876 RepID=UPI001D0A8299|nr:hypothetical protein [Haladaptatus salinisoli]
MKKGAFASGLALGIGVPSLGSGMAQDGGRTVVGVIPQGQYRSGARFRLVSNAIPYAPIENDAQGQEYTTWAISYQGTPGATTMLFVPENVDLQSGQTYQFTTQFNPVGFDGGAGGFGPRFNEGAIDNDVVYDDPAELGLIAVQFSPVQGGTTTPGGNQTTGNQTQGNQTGGNQTTGG